MWVDRTAFPSWARTGMGLDSEGRLAYNACPLHPEGQLFFPDLERPCQNKTIWGIRGHMEPVGGGIVQE